MLAWSNRIPAWIKHQENGRWSENRWADFVPTELKKKTVGILGYGSIGREVARLCKAFDMTVLATKRDVLKPADSGYTLPKTGDPTGELLTRLYPPQATRSMVALCDFVVLALPMTTETANLIDEEMLQAMKPNSYLINVGRGGVIDEKALAKALRKGWIAGAGLDVFVEEPLSSSSPFWKMDNVIMTPHVSGFTPEYDERVTDLFAENLRCYLAGEPLLNVVNRELGY
jgi:phosphoglycerate dehydrogenase-like enzyme